MILICGILGQAEDPQLRIDLRSAMKSAGLPEILEICRGFGYGPIDKQLAILDDLAKADSDYLREKYSQERLQDYDNPEEIYGVIQRRVRDSRASRHFLSMMQHLLLIEEEGSQLDHMYELLDSAVTDIVMDNKLGRAEGRLGTSVQRLIAQLNERERLQEVEEQAAESRAQLVQLRLANEALQEEVAQGAGGLVGQLKQQVASLEEKLSGARETIQSLQAQLHEQRLEYEEQIRQLEAQIMELFRMLKELGVHSDQLGNSGNLDRRELIATLERQLQRNNAMQMLERRSTARKRRVSSGIDTSVEDSGSVNSSKTVGASKGTAQQHRGSGSHVTPARDSQFLDADESVVQEHIESHLAANIDGVSTIKFCLIGSILFVNTFHSTLPTIVEALVPVVSGTLLVETIHLDWHKSTMKYTTNQIVVHLSQTSLRKMASAVDGAQMRRIPRVNTDHLPKVDIQHSLIRPKQLRNQSTFLGQSGNNYPLLRSLQIS